MDIPASLKTYMAVWLGLCLMAVFMAARRRRSLSLFSPGYRQFLAVPWKLATFAIALVGIVVIAPYTGDPTWDYFDAAFMGILTYLTAPWSVGTLYLALTRRGNFGLAFIAACVWLFTASWSYDLYLVLRDGAYPMTWEANLGASSVLYVCGGLLWSLEWRPGRGATFGFLESGWPQGPPSRDFARVLLFALPFMTIAAVGILYFFF